MCGRLALTLPHEAMVQLFQARPANDLPQVPNTNVCPTVQVHVVTSGAEGRSLGSMRWGFVPHWYKAMNGGPLLINARAETLAEKPAFRAACRERRCIIPASWFYEWTTRDDGSKQPWKIGAVDGRPLAFAGIWQDWEQAGERIATCAIVTCGANETLAELHHRMPVILDEADWALWLGEEGKGAAALMQPAPDDLLEFEVIEKL